MTASPPSRVPGAASVTPSSLTTSSAVLLSLLPSISATTDDSGAESTDAISTAPAGDVPDVASPSTTMPRSSSRASELPRGGGAGVGGAEFFTEHPGVVRHERVVGSALQTLNADTPARSEELVVVPGAVTDDPAGPR